MSTTRSIVIIAFVVCSVLNTKCPVSDAEMHASKVSLSRISPLRVTSGSSRRNARNARSKCYVSRATPAPRRAGHAVPIPAALSVTGGLLAPLGGLLLGRHGLLIDFRFTRRCHVANPFNFQRNLTGPAFP